MESPDFSKIEKPPESRDLSKIDPKELWYYTWRDTSKPKYNRYKNVNYSNNYIATHPELKLRRLQSNLTTYFGCGE